MRHTALVSCVAFLLVARAVIAPPLSAQAAGGRTAEQIRASYDAHHADFDYLLGDWAFTAANQQYGAMRGFWSAVRLDDGQVLDEYRIVGDSGQTYYVTKTLRAYNAVLDRWELVSTEGGTGLQNVGTGGRTRDPGRVRRLRVSVLRRRLPRAAARAARARTQGPLRVPALSAGRRAPPRPPGRGGGRGRRRAGQVLADARSPVSASSGARGRGPGGVRARARDRCRPGDARAGRTHLRRARARGLPERRPERRERYPAVLHQWPPARGAGRCENARRRAAAGPVERKAGTGGGTRTRTEHRPRVSQARCRLAC